MNELSESDSQQDSPPSSPPPSFFLRSLLPTRRSASTFLHNGNQRSYKANVKCESRPPIAKPTAARKKEAIAKQTAGRKDVQRELSDLYIAVLATPKRPHGDQHHTLLPLANQRHEQISAKISPPSQQSPFDNLMNALARTIERTPKSTLTGSPTPPPRNVMAAVFAPAVEARLGAQKIVKGPTNGRKAELAQRVREPKSGKESQNLIRTPPKEALTGKDSEGEYGEDLDEVGEENRGSQHPVHLCRKLVNTITMEEDAMRCVLAAKELEAAGKHDAAEQSYNRAMGLSKSSDVLAAYGLFVQNVRGDDGRAESLYKLSLKNNPAHLETLQNYAIFLEERRGDLNQAESLYATAVEATRNGFINELKTATTESSRARANNETGDARCLLHDTLPVLRSDTDYESAGSESGGIKRNLINDRKMSSKPASKTAGPRHLPQKEELGRSLRHASERRMPGSAHGRVDAERRFTDGTYRIADVNASDTRHLKSYTGTLHNVPWMGPLDVSKRVKKKNTPGKGAGKARQEASMVVGGVARADTNLRKAVEDQHAESSYIPGHILSRSISLPSRCSDLLMDSREDLHSGEEQTRTTWSHGARLSSNNSTVGVEWERREHAPSDLDQTGTQRASISSISDLNSFRCDQPDYISDSNAFRYDPQLRLKVRESFSSLEHLQQAGVIVSHTHICSIMKNTLNLDLDRNTGVKFVKHFLARPECARQSSSFAEERKTRYEAFAEDVWRELKKKQKSIRPKMTRHLDPDMDALPDFMMPEDGQVAKQKTMSVKSWLTSTRSSFFTLPSRNTETSSESILFEPHQQSQLDLKPSAMAHVDTSDMLIDNISELSRSASLQSSDSVAELMLHPGRQYSKIELQLYAGRQDQPGKHVDASVKDAAIIQPSESASLVCGSSSNVLHGCKNWLRKNKVDTMVAREFDIDDCFDPDSAHYPKSMASKETLKAPKRHQSASLLSTSATPLPVVSDLVGLPSNLVSKATCKFEVLRPQDHLNNRIAVADSVHDFTQKRGSEQRLSVDHILSAVQKSLWAHEQSKEQDAPPSISDENHIEPADLLWKGECATVQTRAGQSLHARTSLFRRRESSSTPSLSHDKLQKVSEDIFSALRQKFHTGTMIFGYLSSRAVEGQNNLHARPGSAKAYGTIGKDDFKAAISQLGLGFTETEIMDTYELNADMRTGELTFRQLQRAIKALSTHSNTIFKPRSQAKEPKESDKIRDVLKRVWSSAAEAFYFFDISGSDALNPIQLRQGLKRLGLSSIRHQVAFQEIDLDRDGRISDRDFIKHFAAGWHPLGDFLQIRKDYENVKANGRNRVNHDFQQYVEQLKREDVDLLVSASQSPTRTSPLSARKTSPLSLLGDMKETISQTRRDPDQHFINGPFADFDFHGIDVKESSSSRSHGVLQRTVGRDTLAPEPPDVKGPPQHLNSETRPLAQHPPPSIPSSETSPSPPLKLPANQGHYSPVILGLDLHGFKSGNPRRTSACMPVLSDDSDNNYDPNGLPKSLEENEIREDRKRVRLPALKMNLIFPDALVRTDSNDTETVTSLAISDFADSITPESIEDSYGDRFESFHRRSARPLGVSMTVRRAVLGTGNSKDPAISTAGEPAEQLRSPKKLAKDSHHSHDENFMTATKLAALRLQIKREKEEEFRLKEKEIIWQHRHMLMEKRRNQRLMQEAARLERSRLHKSTLPAEGTLRLFSRYRESEPRLKSDNRRAPRQRSAPASPLHDGRDENSFASSEPELSIQKRPASAENAAPSRQAEQRSVRWDRPQVRTFETSGGAGRQNSGTSSASEEDIDGASESSSDYE